MKKKTKRLIKLTGYASLFLCGIALFIPSFVKWLVSFSIMYLVLALFGIFLFVFSFIRMDKLD